MRFYRALSPQIFEPHLAIARAGSRGWVFQSLVAMRRDIKIQIPKARLSFNLFSLLKSSSNVGYIRYPVYPASRYAVAVGEAECYEPIPSTHPYGIRLHEGSFL